MDSVLINITDAPLNITVNPSDLSGGIVQQAEIDFGTVNDYIAKITIADTNIKINSRVVCSIAGEITIDHSIDEVVIAGIVVVAGNVINGTSFDIFAYCENGTTGKYKVNYIIKY